MSPAVSGRQVDRRVLGGFLFLDAITGASVTDPLAVSNTSLTLRVNRSGIYAIINAPGFSNLNTEFDPQPDWPAADGPLFEITVQDRSLQYLPRRAQVAAPQSLASLATPQKVALYPGPSSHVEPNWAIIRASVSDGSGAGLPWAVLEAIRSDNSVAATGMTDARGEAMLAVPGLGLQVSADSSGAVTETTQPVTIQAWFDPTTLQQPAGWIPNPDDILNNLSSTSLKTNKLTGALGAGQTLFAAITITV
jgi:hypothetical protein